MQLDCPDQDGYHLAVCDGQLDEAAHNAFRQVLHPLFVERNVNVVVDLSDVSFINSEGIAAMVRLVADANTKGCRVIFAAAGTFVREVLNVTRLSNYFETADTRAAAVELLSVSEE